MIQVFDTHRLSYRNAILRAFKLDGDNTTPISFYDVTGPITNIEDFNIGEVVQTNESGYLCYGSNQQQVTCLVVRESALIKLSLDGGTSWPVSWAVNIVNDAVAPTDISTLKFYDGDGSIATYNPLGPGKQLPDYVRRDEFDGGNIWQEDTINVDDNSLSIALTVWTRVINIPSTFIENTLAIDWSALRAGQIVVVRTDKAIDISLPNPNGHVPLGICNVGDYVMYKNVQDGVNLIPFQVLATQTPLYVRELASNNAIIQVPDIASGFIFIQNKQDGPNYMLPRYGKLQFGDGTFMSVRTGDIIPISWNKPVVFTHQSDQTNINADTEDCELNYSVIEDSTTVANIFVSFSHNLILSADNYMPMHSTVIIDARNGLFSGKFQIKYNNTTILVKDFSGTPLAATAAFNLKFVHDANGMFEGVVATEATAAFF